MREAKAREAKPDSRSWRELRSLVRQNEPAVLAESETGRGDNLPDVAVGVREVAAIAAIVGWFGRAQWLSTRLDCLREAFVHFFPCAAVPGQGRAAEDLEHRIGRHGRVLPELRPVPQCKQQTARVEEGDLVSGGADLPLKPKPLVESCARGHVAHAKSHRGETRTLHYSTKQVQLLGAFDRRLEMLRRERPLGFIQPKLLAGEFETAAEHPGIGSGAGLPFAPGGIVILAAAHAADQLEHVLDAVAIIRLQPFAEQVAYFQRQAQQHVTRA